MNNYEPPVFKAWPKLARLNRDIVVTEKLDGTNSAVGITEDGRVYAQSRTRIITPDDDNFGFARWVEDNKFQLGVELGVGLHFGEWYGKGIQRNYGLAVRRFALFNTERHGWLNDPALIASHPEVLCSAVPVLYQGPFDGRGSGDDIMPWEVAIRDLRIDGSRAVPGFMNAEGIVIFHTAASTMFKVTIENDESPKGLVKAGASA